MPIKKSKMSNKTPKSQSNKTVTISENIDKIQGSDPSLNKSKKFGKDVVFLCYGHTHTVGLKSDGTVVAVGENSRGQCDVDSWKNIVSICAGENHTVGLRSDGTVVATGANESNQCNVKTWKDIVSIGIGANGISTVGLKSDGTLISTSKSVNKEFSNYRLFASVKTK